MKKAADQADALAGRNGLQKFLAEIRLMHHLLRDEIRHQAGVIGLIQQGGDSRPYLLGKMGDPILDRVPQGFHRCFAFPALQSFG